MNYANYFTFLWHFILPFCGILLYLFVAFRFTFLWHFALPFCGKHYFAEGLIKRKPPP
jgi:hypothetical protein